MLSPIAAPMAVENPRQNPYIAPLLNVNRKIGPTGETAVIPIRKHFIKNI
jgi:hypothetical protein